MNDVTLALKSIDQERVHDMAEKIVHALDDELSVMEAAGALACVLGVIIDASQNKIATSAAVLGALDVNLRGSQLTLEEAVKVQQMMRNVGDRIVRAKTPLPRAKNEEMH